MKFRFFKAKNFVTFPEVELSFEGGLTLVHGWNHDKGQANGAGKSVLFNSVAYSVYGKMVTDVNLHDLVPAWGGPVVTDVELEVPAGLARIVRSREPNHVKLYLDGEEFKGTAAKVEERIASLVGLTFEQFLQVAYFYQGAVDRFVDVNDTQKKSFLASVLGLDRCEVAYKAAHAEATKMESVVAKDEGRLHALTQVLEAQLAAARAADHRLAEFRAGKEAEVAAIKARHASTGRPSKMVDDLERLLAEVMVAKEVVAGLPNLPDRSELAARADLAMKAGMVLARTRTELEANEREGRKLREQADARNCYACGQALPTNANLGDLILANAAQAEVLRTKVGKAELLVGKVNEAAKQLGELDRAAEGARCAQALLDSKTKELAAAQAILAQQAELEAQRILALDRAIAALEERECTLVEYAAIAQRAADEAAARVATAEGELAKGRENLAYLLEAKQIFSPTGVRAHVVDGVVADLNERAAYYVDALAGDGMQFRYELDSAGKLVGKLSYDGRERSSIATLSGGQRQRVRLAVDLALSDVVSSRLAVRPNVLFLDEVTSGMDVVGRGRLMTLLQELERTRDVIFIADHESEFKTRFSRGVRLDLKDGKTTVSPGV